VIHTPLLRIVSVSYRGLRTEGYGRFVAGIGAVLVAVILCTAPNLEPREDRGKWRADE